MSVKAMKNIQQISRDITNYLTKNAASFRKSSKKRRINNLKVGKSLSEIRSSKTSSAGVDSDVIYKKDQSQSKMIRS